MSAVAARRRRRARRHHRPARKTGWTEAHVRRLFWRAGFGATPAEARRWAKRGKRATLDYVVNGPPGGALLRGPEPRGGLSPPKPPKQRGEDRRRGVEHKG
ncbi:MAG: hypothetical protein ACTHOE_02155 [Conexibacter sp.]